MRLTDRYDLHVVARYTGPTTTGRRLAALVVIALAALAAILGRQYARAAAGTDWLLMFLAGPGAFAVVTTVYQWGAGPAGPRRIRVFAPGLHRLRPWAMPSRTTAASGHVV